MSQSGLFQEIGRVGEFSEKRKLMSRAPGGEGWETKLKQRGGLKAFL